MFLHTEILDVQKMQAAEQLAMQAGIAGAVLMENAGTAVAEEIEKRWPVRKTVVLCGPGNNGGDGFVIARLLAKSGWPIRLGLLGDVEKLPPDARHHAALYQGNPEPCSFALLEDAELVVD